MPRFVVLRHDVANGTPRGLHWDFMLETGEVLRTWALSTEPAYGASCPAEQLPDHRPLYLDYEGEISGGRGTVSRYDWGDYRLVRAEQDVVVVQLTGARFRGTATLRQMGADGQRWTFSFASEGTAASGFSRGSTASESSERRGTV